MTAAKYPQLLEEKFRLCPNLNIVRRLSAYHVVERQMGGGFLSLNVVRQHFEFKALSFALPSPPLIVAGYLDTCVVSSRLFLVMFFISSGSPLVEFRDGCHANTKENWQISCANHRSTECWEDDHSEMHCAIGRWESECFLQP